MGPLAVKRLNKGWIYLWTYPLLHEGITSCLFRGDFILSLYLAKFFQKNEREPLLSRQLRGRERLQGRARIFSYLTLWIEESLWPSSRVGDRQNRGQTNQERFILFIVVFMRSLHVLYTVVFLCLMTKTTTINFLSEHVLTSFSFPDFTWKSFTGSFSLLFKQVTFLSRSCCNLRYYFE